MTSARIAIYGGDEVRAAVLALGFEIVDVPDAEVAIVDAREREQLARAAALPAALPRLTIVDDVERSLLTALGIDASRMVMGADPAVIGPALVALIPKPSRAATRTVVVIGVRGGVGRTLLVANLARRIAKSIRVCAVDATGTGALGWWLGASPRSWSEIGAVAHEMSAEHLAVLSEAISERLRMIGGAPVAPNATTLEAVVRVAATADDLILIDAPLCPDPVSRALAARADRRVLVAYDDPWSHLALKADPPLERDWLIASQMKPGKLAGYATFRALPRDEAAVASAMSSRSAVGGTLGRAYDDLAELIAIDATDT